MCCNFCLGRGAARLKRVGKTPLSQQHHIELRKMFLCRFAREIFGITEGVGNTWGEAVLLLVQTLPSSRPGQATWSPQSQGEPGAQAAATQGGRRQRVLSSLTLPGLTIQTPKTPCMCLGASAHAKLQVAKGQGDHGTQRAERTARGLQCST